MSGRSGVYLVSSKPTDPTTGYENAGYQDSEQKVAYNTFKDGVDISEKQMPSQPYRGMGKEELLHFSSQPFWRRLRMICVSIVLIGWLALIITVVALVLAYPRCREPGARSWWQTESVYRIYVPSFKDSDGDGIGDLAGIESKLDYIQDQGFNIISLSPFYSTDASTPFGDGNDMAIVDHTVVGDKFGTIDAFDRLVTAAHDKGMYVVVDFIPNLTSKKHPWFTASSGNPAGDKRNYYVWAGDAANPLPNNWMSQYGGPAWTLDSTRNQSYLHQFDSDTPDLNLRSALLRSELEEILKFWLDHGADGFNIRDAAYLYEDYDLRDNPAGGGEPMTTNQPEVYGLLEQWRILVRTNNKTNTEKVLMTNIDGGLDVSRLYSSCAASGVQMPLNTNFRGKSDSCDGGCIASYVDDWMASVPSGKWANWVTGDENSDRLFSRLNSSYIDAYTVLTFLLPGTPVLYNGDELGALNTGGTGSTSGARTSNARGIMPWDSNSTLPAFCGNCSSAWADVSQRADSGRGPLSTLIKDLVALRAEQSFRVGEYARALADNEVFSFVREFDGETGYLVAANFGPNKVTRDFTGSHDTIPSEGVIALSRGTPYAVDEDVEPSKLEIDPYGAVVVSWDYVAKEL